MDDSRLPSQEETDEFMDLLKGEPIVFVSPERFKAMAKLCAEYDADWRKNHYDPAMSMPIPIRTDI